jgi:hypothetical protein
MLNSIKDVLEDHQQAVIENCACAIPLLETAMNSVDDSWRDVGSILEEFQHLHYEACELGPPDPLVLADYLLRAEMDSDFSSFSNAVET